MERYADRKLRTYSGGMKQRIGIAQSLLNDPELLIVDEPTAGLDPEERVRFRTLLANFTRDRLVVLSTHIISDVEAVAGRLLLLKEGTLVANTTPEELLKRAMGQVWSVTTDATHATRLQAIYGVSGLVSHLADADCTRHRCFVLGHQKRIDVLLDAVTKLQSQGHIILVGIGPAEAALRTQIERLHLGNRISMPGFIKNDDLLTLRRSSDMYVITSESELQSLSTMEAMACGLPVIAADSYALPELVCHKENGFLFQPGNSDQLSQYIDRMLKDAALRTSMGRESLKSIIKHDRSKVLNQWEILYHNLSISHTESHTTVA